MAGIITGLRFQKHAPDRVSLYLDGRFAFGLPAIEAARLHPGQHLDDAEIERLRGLDVEQKAYDRAVRFLAHRPRSQLEVQRSLEQSGIDQSVVQAIIDRLVRQGYLDDAEFARFWVEDRQRFRPRGAYALRQELRQKGVDDVTIETAVADLDVAASAYDAAHPRALRLSHLIKSDPKMFRRKLSDFLLRRGFDYDVVSETVSRLVREFSELES
jgi:regulatory protein